MSVDIANDIEARTLEIARDLWDSTEVRSFNKFHSDFWIGRMLDWSMQHPDLKVDLFRMVDVLPALQTSSEIQRHVSEYLVTNGRDIPRAARSLFRLAGNGLPATLTAAAVKKSVHEFALRFIVAEDLDKAIPRLKGLYLKGVGATVDLLGESTLGNDEAATYCGRYRDLIERLPRETERWPASPALEQNHLGPIPRANVSIKPSALEPRLEPVDMAGSVARLKARVIPLLVDAVSRGVFINFDMEQWSLHEITIRTIEEALMTPELRMWPHFGVAIQTYTRESRRDLDRLYALARERGQPITVRLVKGAYWDYEVVHARQHGFECPVFEEKAETDANFESLSSIMLERNDWLVPAFASHNLRSIAHAIAVAEATGVSDATFEFQLLYGMAEPLRAVLHERGYRVRVYAPVGELVPGMGYLVRRLLENTSNESFLRLSSRDGKDIEQLLAKPMPKHRLLRTTYSMTSDPSVPFMNCPHRDFTNESQRSELAQAIAGFEKRFPIKVDPVIDGARRSGGALLRRMSPNDRGTCIAEVSMATLDEADEAVQTAWIAWPTWRDRNVQDRANFLEALAALLERDRASLAALEVHETAKPWAEADADIAEAIDFCRYYARQAMVELVPEIMRLVPGETNVLCYEGRGPTAVIAPWNFPIAILCGMSTAALVSGNPILMKPAEQSSATAYALFEKMIEAGIPADVVQFVPGLGNDVGALLVQHPLVAHVAFTGSKAVGLSILEQIGYRHAEQSHLKSAICEMGGKNAIIIDDDADLDEAVRGVVESAFGYAGQKCSACSRVVVVKGAWDAFTRRIVDAVESLRIAPATEPGCQLPPVIDDDARARLLNELDLADHAGEVLYRASMYPDAGLFVPPVIIHVHDTRARIFQEELFGPILCLARVETFDEAISVALDSDYALTGAVYSRSPSHLDIARERFRVGNLYLNRGSTGAMVGRQPFGGFKMSGTDAKAGGPGYLRRFVDARCITENTMRQGFAPELTV